MMGRDHADAAASLATRRLRAASKAAFAAALLLPALATLLGAIPEARGAVITGTVLLPLLAGAIVANVLGWKRTMDAKARIYLAVGLVFAVWSAAEVLSACAEAASGTRPLADSGWTSPVSASPRRRT